MEIENKIQQEFEVTNARLGRIRLKFEICTDLSLVHNGFTSPSTDFVLNCGGRQLF
jgi:hypothetical protein